MKTIPSTQESAPTALMGIENDTRQSRRGKPPYKRNAPHANTGIENNTHNIEKTPPCPHRYRKRYPAPKRAHPPPSWVSKTIPNKKVHSTTALMGIENDTLQSRRGKPPHKRNAPHANTGIENDTRQKRVAFNDMRAFALNGMRTLAEC